MIKNPKRILFFSCEPGGAEALIPVIKLLQLQPRLEVVITGYGFALERFKKKQVDCTEIKPVQKNDDSLIDRYEPNMLITSATSLPTADMSEKYLWWQAKHLGIPTLAFLDQWQNYSKRFSGAESNENLVYLPDWINCLNEIGRREMLAEGFKEVNLVTFGHPYLSSLDNEFAALDVGKLRGDLRLSAKDKVALFVSEPICENYGDSRGYNQYQVLDFFLSNVTDQEGQFRVLVKLHPKDNRASFERLMTRYSHFSPLFIENELSSLECLSVADYVFGMTSIMLIEAYVLGKYVVSLQPHLSGEDPLVLSRLKLIPVVLSAEKLNLFKFDQNISTQFDVEFLSDKLLSFICSALEGSLR